MGSGYICRVIFNAVLTKNCSSSKELLVCEAAAGRGPESQLRLQKQVLAPKSERLGFIRVCGCCRIVDCYFHNKHY